MIDFLRKIIPEPVLLFYHKCFAVLANLIYRFPGRKLYVIGVTGTNGKTTTVNLITSILEETGQKVGMTSTVYFQIGHKKWFNKTKMTVPGRFFFPKMLSKMVKAGCKYAVLEVSSHAIRQNRVWGIPFDAAVMTNLTHDHLDYHHSFEDYRDTKGELFENLSISKRQKSGNDKVSVINADDPESWYFAQFWAQKKYAYTITGADIGIQKVEATDIKVQDSKTNFSLITPSGKTEISLNLLGRYNVSNALAATSLALSQDIKLPVVKKGLERVKGISGRMEEVDVGQSFKVFVDYAHTPDAFQKVFETVKQLPHKKIISVFGATGDRDKEKRPTLGEIGARYSDYVFLTLEDPGSEDPAAIIQAIEPGVVREGKIKNQTYFKIVDREKAIEKAMDKASTGDIVLLLAKGHERVMQMKGKKTPWDEKKVAQKILSKLKKKG